MSQVSDLVKDAKLPTKIDSVYTTHTFLESTLVAGRRARRREREEVWERKRHLGIGICGTVWLEECVADEESKLRAVKEVRKIVPGSKLLDYSRELEAIVKFSQQRFDGCFTKSPGWFENAESMFICMEYFPLGDLQKYLTRPFAEDEAQQITLQLLEGLDFMHSNGFAHGDLRPQHIFVLSTGPDWWVKIGDFGINKRVMEGLTGLQTFNSTPAFIAPEVYQRIWMPKGEQKFTSELEFTPEVDIWSLGVIAYYMLTSMLPFLGQSDLLSYYKGETELPLSAVTRQQTTTEASSFLEKTLASTPAQRLPAREALEHPWLIPLLEDSEPDDSRQRKSIVEEAVVRPLQIQTQQANQDVMLPGTIDLSPAPDTPITTDLTFPVSPTRLGISGTYQKIINTGHPALMANPGHAAKDSASITRSQYSESQGSDLALQSNYSRQISSLDTSSLDPLPSYILRRKSDDAPIPLSDLDYLPSRSESPGSSSRHSTDRIADRIFRVPRDFVHKRSQRSNEYGKAQGLKREKGGKKEKERERSIDVPLSPLSSTPSIKSKAKSHIVEIPGRPQFAEGLPMFPMRSKKA